MTGTPPLPTFVVGGAMRSGTTTLHRWLDAHPDVFMSPVKEIQFFAWDDLWERGFDWYREHFAAWDGETAIGEASPNYLFSPEAPGRLAAHIPDVRFVAVLRNPVDRAYSHWWFHRTAGRERQSFEAAMGVGRQQPPSQYEKRGRYADQLERVLAHLPADHVKVLLTEDLRDRAEPVFADLCSFLGVDGAELPSEVGTAANTREHGIGYNVRWRSSWWSRVPRVARPHVTRWAKRRLQWEPMDPATRATLTARFAEPNARLAELIGRDLSYWA